MHVLRIQSKILVDRLEKENRILGGAEKMLQVLEYEHREGKDELRAKVESELSVAKAHIAAVNRKMEQLRDASGELSFRGSNATQVSGQRRTVQGTTEKASRCDGWRCRTRCLGSTRFVWL